MDKIIADVRRAGCGLRTDKGELTILCYADDAVLISENKDELQKLLHQFYLTATLYNMMISVPKTKSLVIAKEPIRCKLAVNDEIIEQVMSFKYLGVEISSNQDRKKEVQGQIDKAARISGCLKEIIWRNKHMKREAKVKIYKTCVRPIMTYAAETRADIRKTKSMVRTTEMRTLRAIAGYTLRDRVPNVAVREICGVQDIIRWIKRGAHTFA
ncbi:uncharacterized protein LOC126849579 [Cataglyphis hispanica]|uniref:uncharacterized protein LOC126849579 n=1 Tax=Cataglyphis hispanica TaxID=1086592 RepID=UPI00217F5ADF|nr:uncharacterized protein LOC126849579 [Cataglyphis hispanica]